MIELQWRRGQQAKRLVHIIYIDVTTTPIIYLILKFALDAAVDSGV